MKNALNNSGTYAKFIAGTAWAIVTALTPYYGGDKWFTAVTAGIGAALVYFVPNSPKITPPDNSTVAITPPSITPVEVAELPPVASTGPGM